ncbi:MAG: hypothetical protein B6D44_09795, partial [Ignavibacteriales bacterium UTCHB2]
LKGIYLIFFMIVLPFYLCASNYYVDKNAIGLNNGTSWANAWQSLSAINWNLIQPGDVIYVSGGTDSTIYYEQLTVDKNGTSTNPISIIVGKFAPNPNGHSGRVILDGGGFLGGDGKWRGTHTGSNNQAELRDANANFIIGSLIGLKIINRSDSSWQPIPGYWSFATGTITANTATSVVTTLSGGTDNDWDSADKYEIEPRNQSIYVHDKKYVIIKGFECRNANKGVHVEGDNWVKNIVLDSLVIYDFYDQAGIFLNGDQTLYTVESVTIMNCNIISPLLVAGETDCIYIQGAQHTVIHDNFIRNRNQDSLAHNDALQSYHSSGFIIYNNILINDSVNSSEGGGMPIILGAEGNNPVVIYNNFIYMGGAWYAQANMGGALCLRWYDRFPMPPTYVINNTIIVNGPRVRGFWWEYGCNLAVNNIIAMYCPPNYRNLTWMSNLDVGQYNIAGGPANVENIRNNLFWKMDSDIDFSGEYAGNGNTGSVSGWSSWSNIYSGTGINVDPLLVCNIGYEPDQGALNGELQPGTPATNAGENVQALINSFGLPWSDIKGNPRDSSPDIGAYQYSSESDSTFFLSVQVINNFNLVSVPGINPEGMGVNTWWAYRDQTANVYKYENGYLPISTTTPGTGYWMKHSGNRFYNTGEEWPATGIQTVTHTPINGTTGWNLIGGYEASIDNANIVTNPPGLISGPIYKYSGGYYRSATMNPGYGYWVKLSGIGQIILSDTLTKTQESIEWIQEDWGKIIFTDAAGVSYTLYAVKDEVDLNQYELPPVPLDGIFDIRFSSGRIAENLERGEQTIELRGINYPVYIKVDNMNITFQDEKGKQKTATLNNGEETIINDRSISNLKIVSGQIIIPKEFSLEQSFPNPFNPSTTIRFSLPEAMNVTLSIYNVLGEKITELVNAKLDVGKYSYIWNSEQSGAATGLYIYELRTEKSILTKKMLLIK